jgi:predicted DNA-binding protein (MmcQ/YjbR family)
MKPERFEAVLLTGHKGAAFEVPFDPEERWSVRSMPIRKGRRGILVSGTVNRIAFESVIVARSRRFYILIDHDVRERAGVNIGDSALLSIRPVTEKRASSKTPGKTSRAAAATLKRVRKFCATLPETTEKIAWGEMTLRVKGHVFAMFDNNHHHGDQIAIWCSAPDGVQDALVSADSLNFFVPPYVGKGGWIGVRVDRTLPDATVIALVEQAYRTIAAKYAPKRRRSATSA